MTKPKPAKPATPEPAPAAPPQGNESQPQGGENSASPHDNAADGSSTEVPPAAAEPMDTDKSETTPAA